MDHERFEDVHRRFLPEIRRYAAQHVDLATAEDVAAEALATVWIRREAAPEEPVALRSWIYTIARYMILHARRAHARRSALLAMLGEQERESSGPAGPEEIVTSRARAMAVFAHLNESDLEIVVLASLAGVEADQIAALLGCSVQTARARLSRARRRLAAGLEREQTADVAPPKADPGPRPGQVRHG